MYVAYVHTIYVFNIIYHMYCISVLERVVGACKWKGDTPIWAMRWSVY